MAQTGFTPILIYSSSTAAAAPVAGNLTNSTLGSELAINITDGKLFYKDNANAIQVIGWKVTPTTAGGTGLTSYTAGDLLYYASGTALTKLGIGGAYQALQVNAGGTAPSWQPSATSVLTAQGDLLYASGANTLARLAKDANATRYLSNTGTTNNPAWAQINLANGVTGVLPVANGGTATSTAFTAGSVLFAGASGVYSQNNAQLFWDNTNNNLVIGSVTSNGKVTVIYNSATSNGVYAENGAANPGVDACFHGNLSSGTGTNNTTAVIFRGRSAGADRFYVFGNGDVVNTNNSYGTLSDVKFKENIVDATPKLDKLMQVRIVNYNLIGEDRKQIGVIAQEIEQILPGLIQEHSDRDKDDNDLGTKSKSVKMSVFVPMLIKAMQEQQTIIKELQIEVAKMKG